MIYGSNNFIYLSIYVFYYYTPETIGFILLRTFITLVMIVGPAAFMTYNPPKPYNVDRF